MRDAETIILGIIWGVIIVAFVVTLLIVYNLKLFPSKRLRNIPFGEIKTGQVFYDYGGEELKVRKYIKTGELEARCLSISGHPLVDFDKSDAVKVEVLRG